ncbi:MAG TPA: CDP-alcohol phosphatidyltransferase family protein [Euryarchaeota archaeon]|nr:CDP-alcohol phosphatidyltransferase family protein [Euryarchaeota archaeon]
MEGESNDGKAHVRFGNMLKNALLGPIANIAVRMGISQHHVTIFRAALLPIALVLGLTYNVVWCAIVAAIIGLLDLVDGTIARARGDPSDRGKFSDIIVDFASYMCVTWMMAHWGVVEIPIAMWLMVVAPLGYLLAVIAKNESRPTDWIIHPFPNHILYILCNSVPFFLYAFLSMDFYFNLFYAITALVMTFHVVRYFYAIQKRWFFT